jgi:hypothetical protein
MVSVVGNDHKRACIVFKRGISTFCGAANGKREFKKWLTQNVLPDMIINAQDTGGKKIRPNFKTFGYRRSAYKNSTGNFGEDAEVGQEQVSMSYRLAF